MKPSHPGGQASRPLRSQVPFRSDKDHNSKKRAFAPNARPSCRPAYFIEQGGLLEFLSGVRTLTVGVLDANSLTHSMGEVADGRMRAASRQAAKSPSGRQTKVHCGGMKCCPPDVTSGGQPLHPSEQAQRPTRATEKPT